MQSLPWLTHTLAAISEARNRLGKGCDQGCNEQALENDEMLDLG